MCSQRGLAQGGLGGSQDELLESGQEEVFSRTEVESGAIEHHFGEEPDVDKQRP
jgi:hypothetical protein